MIRGAEVGVQSPAQWARLVAEVALIFAAFDWSAARLGSDRGQQGLYVGAVVVTAVLLTQRARSAPSMAAAATAVGLGAPRLSGVATSFAIGGLLLLALPVFARVSGASVAFAPDTLRLLPGLFVQGGIAEETLFRGYLFGHVRRGRTFWRAAGLSTLPFVAVHLLLFRTMPWPVALAAVLLSVVMSFPLAHLFELGGGTIWPPALLHFVVQGTVKVLTVSGEPSMAFPAVWTAVSAVLPLGVFAVRRPEAPRYRSGD